MAYQSQFANSRNELDAAGVVVHDVPVAETTVTGRGNPRKAAIQPQFIDAAFFASGVPINGGPDGAAARLAGAFPVFPPPFGLPPSCGKEDGGIKTATGKHTIMAKAKSRRTPSRLTVYNFMRRFAGPALAFRLSFNGRAF